MCGSSDAATVLLLVGLTSSGKTTYARRPGACRCGAVRMPVDEEVFARHGVYGVDYPEHEYFARQAPVLDWARARTASPAAEGQDMMLDHDLWRTAERQEWKARNERDDSNALTVTPQALDDDYARFNVPCGEGEEVSVETLSYPLL